MTILVVVRRRIATSTPSSANCLALGAPDPVLAGHPVVAYVVEVVSEQEICRNS